MAEIEWARRIYGDGWHNAFTDFQLFKGRYYVCFRNGQSHVSPDGKAVVIASDDLVAWHRQVVAINTPGDDRDPHMIAGSDRLFLYTGSVTRSCTADDDGESDRKIRTHCSFSEDGKAWSEPRPVYRDGYWLWGVGSVRERFYGLAYGNEPRYRDQPLTEIHLVQSADGLNWEKVSVVTKNGSEATFRVDPGGEMRVAIRNGDEKRATLATAKPPYTDWEVQDIGEVIPAPRIVEVDGREYVIGRQHIRDPDDRERIVERRTSIWRLDGARTTHVLDLPSAGDTSYAGVVKQEDGAMLVSYYAQHEVEVGKPHFLYPANIYLARVIL